MEKFLTSIDAHKYSVDFLKKFQPESEVPPNDLKNYLKEV